MSDDDIDAMKWLEDKLKESVKPEEVEVEAKYSQAVWFGYVLGG